MDHRDGVGRDVAHLRGCVQAVECSSRFVPAADAGQQVGAEGNGLGVAAGIPHGLVVRAERRVRLPELGERLREIQVIPPSLPG